MTDSKNFADSESIFQQGLTITGNVTDISGEPVIGVTVSIRGTSRGTITDINGNYSLPNVTSGDILVFSFVGMTTGEVPVGDRTVIDFVMEEGAIGLEEVVAIGYGSIEKRDLTGSVSSVGNEELISVGAISPIKALQANVAGVNISQRTGTVGSDFDIQIRGANSLTGAPPLYVVDGVMTDNINFLNINDIVRIDILKDASSTAIYGSRGSNGVIIVTTRTGEGIRARKSEVTYSSFVGVRTISNMPDLLNSYDESVRWNKDRQVTRDLVRGNEIVNSPTYGFPTVFMEDGTDYWAENLASRNGTDWTGELLKPAIQHNHFISASGGNEDVNYIVGFGYQGDDGNAKGQWYKKYNFKASVEARQGDMFSTGANVNLAFSDRELVSRQGYTRQIFRMPNYAPARDKDGNLLRSPMLGISGNVNPYAYLETNSLYNVELYGAKEDDVPNRWFIGEPVNVIYAMVFDGIWQRDELAAEDRQAMEGTAKVKDLNRDGSIDIDNDMKVLGSPDPDWIGSFSTTLRYKNWDFSSTVFTKQGMLIFSPFHEEFTDLNSKVILNIPYYVRENPITEARYSNTHPQPAYQGEYWGEDAEDYGFPGFNKDASFVRIQNITLGYTFSRDLLSKIGIDQLRVYLNALNPLVFTDYEGFDPEWAGATMSGEDATNTSYSIFQLGANIKF